MRRYLNALALIVAFVGLFSGCGLSNSNYGSQSVSGDNNIINDDEILSPIKSINHQIKSEIILDKQISGSQYSLYNYSFTNGSDCIDKIYVFNVDPDTLSEEENKAKIYENNYINKYSYLYLNGKTDSSIQVQKYSRDYINEEPWYCDQYFYIRNLDDKEKLQAYHSYDIGTNGTVFDNEYFYFTYDGSGALIETTDYLGDKNYFYYDEQGVLVGRTFDVTYTYDEKTYSYEKANGNIVKVFSKDPESGYTIGRWEYKYDLNDRIINENYYSYSNNVEKRLSSSVSYSYDDVGNISKIIDKQYDSDIEEYKTTTKSYFYEDNNNLSEIITDDGKSIEYTIFIYTNDPEEYFNEN